jgi:hypothetical protein
MASLQTWEVDKEALFPPVGLTGSQQLHPSLLGWSGKKKSHTNILNLPLSGKCRHGLDKNSEQQGL